MMNLSKFTFRTTILLALAITSVQARENAPTPDPLLEGQVVMSASWVGDNEILLETSEVVMVEPTAGEMPSEWQPNHDNERRHTISSDQLEGVIFYLARDVAKVFDDLTDQITSAETFAEHEADVHRAMVKLDLLNFTLRAINRELTDTSTYGMDPESMTDEQREAERKNLVALESTEIAKAKSLRAMKRFTDATRKYSNREADWLYRQWDYFWKEGLSRAIGAQYHTPAYNFVDKEPAQ